MSNIPRRAALALVGVAGGTVASALLLRKLDAGTARVVVLSHPVSDADTGDLDDLSNLKPTVPPAPAPNIAFTLADGTVRHLAEFRGRGMLINFWATWCHPCVAEMPISDDRGGEAVVRRFYDEHAIVALPILLDASGDAARAFNIRGFPTT